MISREEIHTKIVEYLEENPFYSEDLIDIFINTVGSCGECKHSYYFEEADLLECDNDNLNYTRGTKRSGCTEVTKDWYCADFERKEDA